MLSLVYVFTNLVSEHDHRDIEAQDLQNFLLEKARSNYLGRLWVVLRLSHHPEHLRRVPQ